MKSKREVEIFEKLDEMLMKEEIRNFIKDLVVAYEDLLKNKEMKNEKR